MNPKAEIFSQGEEVISGQTVDSNAAWLSQNLTQLGFDLTHHTACGDRLDTLVDCLLSIAQRADCCICSGGLGPTLDDLTRAAVSQASGLPLVFDPQAYAAIQAYYQQRQREMPEINRVQAYMPQGALRIDNPVGTAPGFMLKIANCWFAFVPGVPREMKAMYSQIQAHLLAQFDLTPKQLVTLRSFGIGESAIQQALADLALPDGVTLGFRAMLDEVQTKLLFEPHLAASEQHRLAKHLQQRIGDYVFAIDGLVDERGGDLFSVVNHTLQQRQWRLVSLESVSGGLLAARCQTADWHKAALIAKQRQQAFQQFALNDTADADLKLAKTLQQQYGCEVVLVQLLDADQQTLTISLLTPDSQQQFSVPYHSGLRPQYVAQMSLDCLRRQL